MSPVTLRLYSRHACHLCEVMHVELLRLLDSRELLIEVLDVDSRPEWREAYGARVPVLCTSEDVVLCEYHLDEERLLLWSAEQDLH